MRLRTLGPAGVFATLNMSTLIVAGAALTAARAAPAGRDCVAEIERGRGPVIVCEFPTRLTDEERRDLKGLTRDMVQDVRCVVSIRIERAQVEAALAAPDLVFEAPPQPVACEVDTADTVYPITATFAPRVVFQGGDAVQATPGLAQVAGVPGYLAWPVVQYVNRSGSISDGMLRIINGYRAHYEARRIMAGRR